MCLIKTYHYYMAFLVFHSPSNDDYCLIIVITFDTQNIHFLILFQRNNFFFFFFLLFYSDMKRLAFECCQLVSKSEIFVFRHRYWHFLYQSDIQSFSFFLTVRCLAFISHKVPSGKTTNDSSRKECESKCL